MDIYIRGSKYNGYIEKEENTYYIVVENDNNYQLKEVEENIRTYDTDFKPITCLYNMCKMYTSFNNIKKYKVHSVITGHINEKNMCIK